MARIPHHDSRRQAKREIDAAIALAWSRYRVLELRLDELGTHIARARRVAVVAGTIDPSSPRVVGPVRVHEPVPAPARRRRRLAPRIAVARAPTQLL